jgi:hypothetical protein
VNRKPNLPIGPISYGINKISNLDILSIASRLTIMVIIREPSK